MTAYGPIDHTPWGAQSKDGWLNELHEPLAGIPLGEYDRRILEWAAGTLDNPTLAVLVSLLHRARAADPLPADHSQGGD